MPNADDSMDAALAQQVVSNWLDDEHQPSATAIKANGWSAVPVADAVSPMEAEWLAGAIRAIGETQVIGIAFEYNREPISQTVAADRDSILAFHGENSYRYAILIDRSKRFLSYKDHANRFCLLCGPSSFVRMAYPCSYDTVRMMYEQWADDEYNSEEERKVLVRVWSKYSELKPA